MLEHGNTSHVRACALWFEERNIPLHFCASSLFSVPDEYLRHFVDWDEVGVRMQQLNALLEMAPTKKKRPEHAAAIEKLVLWLECNAPGVRYSVSVRRYVLPGKN